MTSTAPPAPRAKRRRSDFRGDRRRLAVRLPVDVAERVERDAQAAGLSISDHLGRLAGLTPKRGRP
jgi:hypothetical protein